MENMMKMETFRNQEFGSVRIIRDDGRLLFCGIDVAAALGYSKPRNAVYAHCKDNEYSRLISFRIDWFDLLEVQGALKSLLCYGNSFKVQFRHNYLISLKDKNKWKVTVYHICTYFNCSLTQCS